MIVSDGRIDWVGPVASLRVPPGATIIELAGKYVMPGIIDLHVHLALVNGLDQGIKYYSRAGVERDLRTYASYGVTTVQALGTDKDLIFAIRAAQRATGRPAMARIFTAGQGLVYAGSYGGVVGLNRPVATVPEARRAVDLQVANGVDLIKLWVDDELGTMAVRMPPPVSTAVIDEAHRHRLKAVAHIFYLDDAKRVVAEGVNGLAHCVRDRPVDQALIDSMKSHDSWQMACTLSREASMFAYGGPAPSLQDPFFYQSIAPEVLTTLRSPQRQQAIRGSAHFGEYRALFETAKQNLKREADAGVHYAFGTDAGPSGRFPGYAEHWELSLMVEAGLTPMQALTAATGSAAQFLGDRDIGTLERSRWADLLVLNADPLQDIANTRNIDAVYIAGRRVPSVKP